jgi:hypothetical protein
MSKEMDQGAYQPLTEDERGSSLEPLSSLLVLVLRRHGPGAERPPCYLFRAAAAGVLKRSHRGSAGEDFQVNTGLQDFYLPLYL